MDDKMKIALAAAVVVVSGLTTGCKVTEQQEGFISKMHPSVQNRFRCFVSDLTKAGWEVRIASAWRGWAHSLSIWQRYPAVQRCCQPGRDLHYFGMAMDITLHKPGITLNMAAPRALWIESGVGAIAQKHQLRWGINFNNYYDPVHFDYPKYSINDLVRAQNEQFGTLENDGGNRVNLTGLTPRFADMQAVSNNSIP